MPEELINYRLPIIFPTGVFAPRKTHTILMHSLILEIKPPICEQFLEPKSIGNKSYTVTCFPPGNELCFFFFLELIFIHFGFWIITKIVLMRCAHRNHHRDPQEPKTNHAVSVDSRDNIHHRRDEGTYIFSNQCKYFARIQFFLRK